MKLEDDREILFIQGGATLQFSMVPLNLLMPEDTATFKVINLAGNAVDKGLNVQELSSVPVKLYARAQAGTAEIKYSTPAERDDPVDEYILVSKKDEDGNRIKLAEDGTY